MIRYDLLFFGVFLIFLSLCFFDTRNKDKERCKELGGIYKSFYASKSLCFKQDALLEMKKD